MADQSLVELLTGYAAAPFEYFGYGKRPPPRVGDAAVRSSAGFGFEVPTGADDGGDMRGPTFQRLPGEKPVSPSQTNLLGAPQEDIEARAFSDRTGFEHIPFAHSAIGGAAMLSALPRIAHTTIKEGIDTADRWLSATHQLPGAKATDDLVIPVEKRGTEDYQINPNRVEEHDLLAPLGLASLGNPVSALGREGLRAGAKAGRPSEGYSPSIGDRLVGKYLDATAPMTDHLHPETGKLMMRYQTDPGITMGNPGRAMDSGALYAKEMPQVVGKGYRGLSPPDNDPNRLRLLSDAGKRSSLPGMIQGAVENASRSEKVTPVLPKEFQSAVRSQDIPVSDGVKLRWNEGQQWLDIIQDGKPIGRTFVTTVDKDINTDPTGSRFILGPKLEVENRRQGIGMAIYDAMEAFGQKHGMQLVPGAMMSKEARALWEKRQRRGDRSSGAANAADALKRPKGFGGQIPE